MTIEQGWLTSARKVHSPNHDERPDPDDITLIVIHCISLPPGEFGGPHIDRLFTNSLPANTHPYFNTIHTLKVSAHILIRRDGGTVQYVPFHKRAWHAGASCYAGRKHCNDFSIGIELEGTEDIPYSEHQYLRLSELIGELLQHYHGLSSQRITGHSDIAPDRKTDPGPTFDWSRLHGLLSLIPGIQGG